MPAGRMGEVLAAVWECPKPVVARVGGPARAGGLGIVAAADIAVCTTDATFAFSEVRLGVIPAVISATVLPRLSPRAAAELFLTGERFDGARAAAVGLVTAAVPADELDAAVGGVRRRPWSRRARPRWPRRRRCSAASCHPRRCRNRPFATELADLTDISVGFFTSAEGREGVLSFVEKRDPSWAPTP